MVAAGLVGGGPLPLAPTPGSGTLAKREADSAKVGVGVVWPIEEEKNSSEAAQKASKSSLGSFEEAACISAAMAEHVI